MPLTRSVFPKVGKQNWNTKSEQFQTLPRQKKRGFQQITVMRVFGGKVKVGWWQVGLALIQVKCISPFQRPSPHLATHANQYSQDTKPNQKQFQQQYISGGLINNASNHSLNDSGFPTQQRLIMQSFLTHWVLFNIPDS